MGERGRTSSGVGVGVAVVLVLLLGAGALVGTAPRDEEADTAGQRPGDKEDVTVKGLSSSDQGYTLDLLTPELAAGEAGEVRFRILGPEGQPVTSYVDRHERPLHLIVVARDLGVFSHVHPSLGGDGTWRFTGGPLPPGPYRAFADFAAADGPELTLGHDLVVAGDARPQPLPPRSPTAHVGGYEVELAGRPSAGGAGEVTVIVRRGGEPVSDLEPYLGALGHLVAIRASDLAYLHVHPLDRVAGPGEVPFAVEAPSAGAYRLFFDFSHRGTVRTAAFTVEVPAGAPGPPANGHGDHGGAH